MKKALLALIIAVFCFFKSSVAQTMVTIENNTPQYFVATLLDNTYAGGPITSYYIDVPNNLTQIHPATVQTGYTLTSPALWRGIALRTYPGGVPASIVYFPSAPYTGTFTAAGIVYHITCTIVSATNLYIRITP
jgi:hypothetical protein